MDKIPIKALKFNQHKTYTKHPTVTLNYFNRTHYNNHPSCLFKSTSRKYILEITVSRSPKLYSCQRNFVRQTHYAPVTTIHTQQCFSSSTISISFIYFQTWIRLSLWNAFAADLIVVLILSRQPMIRWTENTISGHTAFPSQMTFYQIVPMASSLLKFGQK